MTEPVAPQPAPQPAPPLTAAEDKQWASFAHFGGVLAILPPLIIWLVFKDRGAQVNKEGKEAVNWQITFLIIIIGTSIINAILAAIISGIAVSSLNIGLLGIIPFLTFILVGLPWIANIVLSILGGIKVNGGGEYRYPVNFRFIK